jgi:hypothetical protein
MHLHQIRPVPGRRGPFSSSASADPPSAAERAMRDQQAVSRPATTSQRCCKQIAGDVQCGRTGLPANHASEPSLHGGPPPVFPTQTGIQKTKISNASRQKKNQASAKNKNQRKEGDGDKSPLAPTHTPPPTSVPTPRRPQVPAPTVLHHDCMCMPGQPSVPEGFNRRRSHTTPNTVSLHIHACCHPHNQARHTTQLHHDSPHPPTLHTRCTQSAAVPTARLHHACNPTNLRTIQYTPISHHLAPRHRAHHTHAMVWPTLATLFLRARYTLCEVESQGRPQHAPAPHTARTRTQGPLFLIRLGRPTLRGTACHARPAGGVQARLPLPPLLQANSRRRAVWAHWVACQPCLGTQPARGTTSCFPHTNKPPQKKQKSDQKKIRPARKTRTRTVTNHPSRRPTHHHPPAYPRPANPKRPLPQSCTTTACACRVSRQSWRASTDAPPTPHQTHFPLIFTRFPTHTTKHATPHSCTMTAPT